MRRGSSSKRTAGLNALKMPQVSHCTAASSSTEEGCCFLPQGMLFMTKGLRTPYLFLEAANGQIIVAHVTVLDPPSKI